jgi:Spx/MgsR family transcriptional regulator
MNITLYGIPNCDTVKKARAWLDERGLAHAFHDYKKQGVPQAEMRSWLTLHGWEKLLNRRGPTWRKLDPARQAAVTDAASALAVMNEQSSVIKRPVLVRGDTVLVGFDADEWARVLG